MIKIATAFPKKIVLPQEIFENCGSDIEFQEEKLGFSKRHILGEGERAIDLAVKACNELFAQENIPKEAVELLIYVTQNPEYLLPQNSSLLQDILKLPQSVCSFDVNLGCSGYVYALNIAKSMMMVNGFKTALIVTCDCYSKIIDKTDKNTASIFGDGATATLITDPYVIGNASFYTNGEGAQHLIKKENEPLHMNGRAIFNFMMKDVSMAIDACLIKNKLGKDDIDYFIFHQASKFLVENLAAILKVPKDKVPIFCSETANTVSSTIPILLRHLFEKTDVSKKNLLLSGFGVGLSSATTIIKL